MMTLEVLNQAWIKKHIYRVMNKTTDIRTGYSKLIMRDLEKDNNHISLSQKLKKNHKAFRIQEDL